MFTDEKMLKKLSNEQLIMRSLAMIIEHSLLPYHTVILPELLKRVKKSNNSLNPTTKDVAG